MHSQRLGRTLLLSCTLLPTPSTAAQPPPDLTFMQVTTKTARKTLSPKWEETFWLLVQEPHSQEMKVCVGGGVWDGFLCRPATVLGMGWGCHEITCSHGHVRLTARLGGSPC